MSDYENPRLPKGGRGKKAPYETKTIRVPVPCLEVITQIVNEYHLNGNVLQIGNNSIDRNQVMLEADKILNSSIGKTKSAKQAVKKLLQVIYGGLND